MKKIIFCLFIIIGFFALNYGSLYADGSPTALLVFPPATVYPGFSRGTFYTKFTLGYVNGSGNGVKVNGGGFDMNARMLCKNWICMAIEFGAFYRTGEAPGYGNIFAGPAGVGMYSPTVTGPSTYHDLVTPLSIGIELQPIKIKRANLLLLTGWQPVFSFLGNQKTDITVIDSVGNTRSGTYESDWGGNVRGNFYTGVQLGLGLGKFKIGPYLIQRNLLATELALEETATISGFRSTIMQINRLQLPSQKVRTIGVDVVYIPSGFTVGIVMTDVPSNGFLTGYQTLMAQVSWQLARRENK